MLGQVMACCVMAPNHYLNQCRFLIKEVLLCSSECNLANYQITILSWKLVLFAITATSPKGQQVNSLTPGKFEWNFRYVIFKWSLVSNGWGISCETALIWMSLDFTDDQSTLVQVMAWCRQATSHYLSQCWPRSLMPYGITRPQWVKMRQSSYWPCHLSDKRDKNILYEILQLLN